MAITAAVLVWSLWTLLLVWFWSKERALNTRLLATTREWKDHSYDLHYKWLCALAEVWAARSLEAGIDEDERLFRQSIARKWQVSAENYLKENIQKGTQS